MYRITEPTCCTPETNTILYTDCISVFKNLNKIDGECSVEQSIMTLGIQGGKYGSGRSKEFQVKNRLQR